MILTLTVCNNSNAQVGINNVSPKSSLDISATNSSAPLPTDGLLIPRVSTFPATDPGSHQDSMLVYLTQDIPGYLKGFHYWDNSVTVKDWIPLILEEWKKGVNTSGDNLIYASRAKITGTDMVITDDGRIGFGTSDPVERFEFRGPGDNDFQITSANTNPPNFILYNTGGTLDSPGPLAANGEIGSFIVKTHDGNGIKENGGFRFYMDGVATPGSTPSRFVINTTPMGSTTQQQRISVRSNGNVGISEADPTATLHIRAGTATAASAPIKLTQGTNLTVAEKGAIEYDGAELYFTPNTTREVLLKGFKKTVNINFSNIPANGSLEYTTTVDGARLGMSCNCSPRGTINWNVNWNCVVSSTNQVKIRIMNLNSYNVNPSAVDWKITVID